MKSFYFPFIEQTEEDFWVSLRDQSTLRGDYDKYGLAQIKPEVDLRQAEAEVGAYRLAYSTGNPGS